MTVAFDAFVEQMFEPFPGVVFDKQNIKQIERMFQELRGKWEPMELKKREIMMKPEPTIDHKSAKSVGVKPAQDNDQNPAENPMRGDMEAQEPKDGDMEAQEPKDGVMKAGNPIVSDMKYGKGKVAALRKKFQSVGPMDTSMMPRPGISEKPAFSWNVDDACPLNVVIGMNVCPTGPGVKTERLGLQAYPMFAGKSEKAGKVIVDQIEKDIEKDQSEKEKSQPLVSVKDRIKLWNNRSNEAIMRDSSKITKVTKTATTVCQQGNHQDSEQGRNSKDTEATAPGSTTEEE